MALSILAMSAFAATTSENLLINPSFEDGINGWTAPDGKWSTVESESGYKPQDGTYFAWPVNATRENTYIYQDIPLGNYSIGNTAIFNVMVCNYDQPPHDMGRVELVFLGADGSIIKGYSQDQRNPDWNSQSIIATIPAGATTARVALHAIWYVGSNVDAYYDNGSFVVTDEKYSMVYISEKDGKEKAVKGETLNLLADNGISQNPSDYLWSSSYNDGATVDAEGVVTMLTDCSDGVAIYAKDKKTGVTGIYRINSDIPNLVAPSGSAWASENLQRAEDLGLIPEVLQGTDLTQSITRAEFAAVAVKAYEALSGTAALPNTVNPFSDTSDIEVLKAYNLGITTGVSASVFEPNTLLNREQALIIAVRMVENLKK